MRSVLALLLAALVVLTPPAAGSVPPQPVLAAVVPTGAAPCGLAVRGAELWVGVYEAGTLLRLDRAGRVIERVRVGSWACRVAAGPAAVWVTRDRPGEVVRISLGSGRRLRVPVGSGAFDVLLAHGSAWATSFDVGIVARISAAAGKLTRVFKVGGSPAGLTLCGGRVWVGHGRDATWLTAIDPTTNRIRRVDVGADAPAWPRCVRGELWVTTPHSALRVSAETGAVLARIALEGTPAEASAAPFGLVWITDKERSRVYRIQPSTNRVLDTFPAGPGAYSQAYTGGSMWVVSFAGADVRRFDP